MFLLFVCVGCLCVSVVFVRLFVKEISMKTNLSLGVTAPCYVPLPRVVSFPSKRFHPAVTRLIAGYMAATRASSTRCQEMMMKMTKSMTKMMMKTTTMVMRVRCR